MYNFAFLIPGFKTYDYKLHNSKIIVTYIAKGNLSIFFLSKQSNLLGKQTKMFKDQHFVLFFSKPG